MRHRRNSKFEYRLLDKGPGGFIVAWHKTRKQAKELIKTSRASLTTNLPKGCGARQRKFFIDGGLRLVITLK